MNLNQLNHLNFKQYRWITRAYFRLWGVKFKLKFKDSRWLTSKLRFSNEPKPQNEGHHRQFDLDHDMQEARLMHECVRLAARLHFSKTDCLPRSLVLVDMLRRNESQAEIVIGVAKQHGDSLASHAWVELSGEMVAEPESVGLEFSKISGPGSVA